MSEQRGRSRAGLSGATVDLPNLTIAQIGADAKAGIKFTGDCYRWSLRQEGKTRPKLGRGGTISQRYRYLYTDGGGYIDVKDIGADWPAPDQFRMQAGTIVYTINGARKITVPIVITSYDPSFDVNRKDAVGARIGYSTTGPAVFSGWPGTQPTATDPTKTDLQTYDGTVFTFDQNGLSDGATVTIDWWGGAGATDVSLIQRLQAKLVAATAPFTGLKLRPASISQDAVDGGTMTLLWGRTDTKDDATLPHWIQVTDPDNINNHAARAGLNSPPVPAGLPNTVVNRTEVFKLNDGTLKIVVSEDKWTDKQAIELGESFVRRTLNHLGDSGQDVKVIATTEVATQTAATAPAGLKAVGTYPQNINAFQSKFTTIFDVTDDAEKILFPELVTSTDPSLLESHQTKGEVFATGYEPDAPTVAGLVFRNKRILQLTNVPESVIVTDFGTSLQANSRSVAFWLFAEKTAADDRTFGETRNNVDPNDIRSSRTTASIITTGAGAPSPGSTLGALKLIDSADIPLTNASASNQSLRIFRWGKRDSLDEEKQPRKKTTVEVNGAFATPSNIGDDGIRVKEWLSNASAPTAPDDPPTNNVKPIAYFDLVLTETVGSAPGTNLRVFLYGSKSSADDLILPNYETNTDVSGIQSTAIRAALDGDSITDPGDPFVWRFTKTRPITLSLGVNRVLTVKIYGLVTVKTEMENAASVFKGDPFTVSADRTATIVPVTGSGPVMRAAALAANQSNADFASVEIQMLNALWARQIIETSGEDKKRHSYHGTWIEDHLNGVPVSMVSGSTVLPNVPAGAYGDTAAKVKVKVKGTAAGGNGFREFTPTPFRRFRGEFRYRRTFITTDPATYYFQSLMGTTNASAFQGWPAHWVSYSHPEVMWTELIVGAHAVTIDFVFQLDSAMFIIADDIPIGDGGFNDSPHVTSSSFVSATTFDATALIRWIPTGDYSVFSA